MTYQRDEHFGDDHNAADFVLDETNVEGHIAMIDDFMADDLDDESRAALAALPAMLGLALEVRFSFDLSPNAAAKVAGNLMRYVRPCCLDRLEGYIETARIARLPSYL